MTTSSGTRPTPYGRCCSFFFSSRRRHTRCSREWSSDVCSSDLLFFDEVEKTLLCSDLFFQPGDPEPVVESEIVGRARDAIQGNLAGPMAKDMPYTPYTDSTRSEEHTSELQSRLHLVCRLLLEKK